MKITVQKNGPFRVEGDDIQISDPQGGTYAGPIENGRDAIAAAIGEALS